MVFAPPQAKLVGIHSPHWVVSAFDRMTWIMGQQHAQIIGFTQGGLEGPMQDYVVVPRDVESLVLEELTKKK